MDLPDPETLILASKPGRPHPVSLREPDLSRKRERQPIRPMRGQHQE
jgi:hypothetical protein